MSYHYHSGLSTHQVYQVKYIRASLRKHTSWFKYIYKPSVNRKRIINIFLDLRDFCFKIVKFYFYGTRFTGCNEPRTIQIRSIILWIVWRCDDSFQFTQQLRLELSTRISVWTIRYRVSWNYYFILFMCSRNIDLKLILLR